MALTSLVGKVEGLTQGIGEFGNGNRLAEMLSAVITGLASHRVRAIEHIDAQKRAFLEQEHGAFAAAAASAAIVKYVSACSKMSPKMLRPLSLLTQYLASPSIRLIRQRGEL